MIRLSKVLAILVMFLVFSPAHGAADVETGMPKDLGIDVGDYIYKTNRGLEFFNQMLKKNIFSMLPAYTDWSGWNRLKTDSVGKNYYQLVHSVTPSTHYEIQLNADKTLARVGVVAEWSLGKHPPLISVIIPPIASTIFPDSKILDRIAVQCQNNVINDKSYIDRINGFVAHCLYDKEDRLFIFSITAVDHR